MDIRPPMRLKRLIEMAVRQPVRVTDLLRMTEDIEDWQWFCDLVRRILPESADLILTEGQDSETVARFRHHFEEKYFPLYEPLMDHLTDRYWMQDPDEQSVWKSFKEGPPFDLYGLEIEDEHEVWEVNRTLVPLLLLLTSGENSGSDWNFDDGVMVTWIEEAARIMDPDILRRMPDPCWTVAQVVTAFERAGQHDLAWAMRWVNHNTGVWGADAYFIEQPWAGSLAFRMGWDEEWLLEIWPESSAD